MIRHSVACNHNDVPHLGKWNSDQGLRLPMIVTLDGPAGAGKSTAAHGLARRLGFRILNTGAMYRAVALAAVRGGLDWNDSQALIELAQRIVIDLPGEQVLLNGEDVTTEIRRSQITDVTHFAANNPGV